MYLWVFYVVQSVCISLPSAAKLSKCLIYIRRAVHHQSRHHITIMRAIWVTTSALTNALFDKQPHRYLPYCLQLRRYRRDNKDPFVSHLSGLGDSSVSLGALFPATYYQRVRVCSNCYRVYTMVDAARTKAVQRLDTRAATATTADLTGRTPGRGYEGNAHKKQKSQQPAAKRTRNTIDGVGSGSQESRDLSPAVGPSPSQNGSGERISEHGNDDRETGQDVSQETLALLRAQAAIDGLTRGDICELRSFSQPPAAVNMVAAALMITLTGEGEPSATGWLASKRFMTDVDSLFAAIAGLDLDRIRVSQIRKLESYARNPAFRPEIVAFVSLPASKLCAWVLGVLVSFWQRRISFSG